MPDFLLYNTPTPNGHQVSVFLEELKIVYPEIQYEQVELPLQAIFIN
jgi:glutathione S-transferase